jgi:hypothetical protein
MRIFGESKLNRHGDTILQMRRDKRTIAEILRFLRQEGVSAGQSTVSDWLKRRMEEPPKTEPASGEPEVPNQTPRSLGLLAGGDNLEEFGNLLKILRIIWLSNRDWEESHVATSVGPEGYGIPLNRDGEPDFTAFARKIGRKRVKSYGDMDFFLLALWTRKVRETCRTPVSDFMTARRRSKLVLEVAAGIRDEMFSAF